MKVSKVMEEVFEDKAKEVSRRDVANGIKVNHKECKVYTCYLLRGRSGNIISISLEKFR